MSYIDITDINALKTFEYGLLIACPLDDDPNPPDCPLHDLRLLSIEERFKWVDALSDEECVRYYLAHKQCYVEKMARAELS